MPINGKKNKLCRNANDNGTGNSINNKGKKGHDDNAEALMFPKLLLIILLSLISEDDSASTGGALARLTKVSGYRNKNYRVTFDPDAERKEE